MVKTRGDLSIGALRLLLGLILAVILFAGLRPWGYSFRNTAALVSDPPGLAFGPHGIAFTRPFISEADATLVAREGLTAILALELADQTPESFAAIAVLHNGNDNSQWFLGQWRHHLILLNGDDYSHERRLPRISLDTRQLPEPRFHLAITSGADGSRLAVNGEPVASRPDFVQSVPAGGRLTVGNNGTGKHPWNGILRGLAFHRKSLNPEQLRNEFLRWSETSRIGPSPELEPWLLYPLDDRIEDPARDRQAPDHSAHGLDLIFPEKTAFLTREFLGPGTVAPLAEEIVSRDSLLNFLGFIPLGWTLARLLENRRPRMGIALLLLAATAAGFALSLGLETLQASMPTRSSSLLDLLLNTGGTFTGALLGRARIPRRRPGPG